jgi:hypothetical protein
MPKNVDIRGVKEKNKVVYLCDCEIPKSQIRDAFF